MSGFPSITIRGQHHDDQEQLYALLTHEAILRESLELPYMAEETFRERYATPVADAHTLILETGLPSGRRSIVGAAWLQSQKRHRLRHSADLSIAVHPEYQNGQDDGALLDAVLDLADRWLRLHRLHGLAFEADQASIALLESRGFVRETVRQAFAVREGEFATAIGLARVREGASASGQPPSLAQPPEAPAPRKLAPAAIRIRAVETADFEDIAELVNSGNVAANTLQLPYRSLDEARERLESPPEGRMQLVAVVKERVVGTLGLQPYEGRRSHVASLGMMVHADYQGRGLGSALMSAAIPYAEQWLNIRRLELDVFTDNGAGIALYHKFGFQDEGIQRGFAWRGGQYVDAYFMARLRRDDSV